MVLVNNVDLRNAEDIDRMCNIPERHEKYLPCFVTFGVLFLITNVRELRNRTLPLFMLKSGTLAREKFQSFRRNALLPSKQIKGVFLKECGEWD